MAADDLTLFEQLELQMKALVPFVRGLQAELGEDVVNDAIDKMRAKAEAGALADKSDGLPLSVNREAFEAWGAGALEYTIVRDEEEAFDVDVTGVNELKLTVECDRFHVRCHGVWMDPVLE